MMTLQGVPTGKIKMGMMYCHLVTWYMSIYGVCFYQTEKGSFVMGGVKESFREEYLNLC